jgi:hypothetical protein
MIKEFGMRIKTEIDNLEHMLNGILHQFSLKENSVACSPQANYTG